MPTTTPPVKVDAVRAYGDHVQVVLHGDTFADALAHAKGIERDRQLTFVHPYDDPHVIAGQGTIAMVRAAALVSALLTFTSRRLFDSTRTRSTPSLSPSAAAA